MEAGNGMKTRVRFGAWLVVLLVAAPTTILFAQSGLLSNGTGSAPAAMRFTSNSNPADSAANSVLRTIDDPSTGQRWILLRDESHPGGPAKLVLSTQDAPRGKESKNAENSAPATSSLPLPANSSAAEPTTALSATTVTLAKTPGTELAVSPEPILIRAGDHLSVERHSAVVDVQLEAVALGPASAGSTFNARLVIGGRIVRAIAIGQGHATFAPGTEGQP